ncbi:MAG: YhdH/YhfP family quinone oxidoreductase [Bacteroidales bacterium]
MKTFKAFRIHETDGVFRSRIENILFEECPSHEVLIKVHYSGINYKDLLSSRGNKGITKVYPHTPGIDAAGIVVSDRSGSFLPGQKVVVMGYDLGMNTDGGFAEYISVPAAWVLPKPDKFTLKETMQIGTSGFTAALGISKMLRMGQKPEDGPILVSGATGGVGIHAVQLLTSLGFDVWAVTGKDAMHQELLNLGAKKILTRQEVSISPEKPLLRPRWAGALDTVGGEMLVAILKQCQKSGSVATCGNVGGISLQMTVFPFILNGINLLGINAADTPMSVRKEVWQLLEQAADPISTGRSGKEITLEEIAGELDLMERGEHIGRDVITLLR